jgi:hydrogenase maturation protein HypF
VSSLLDICQEATYEGQPAIMLEGVADPSSGTDIDFGVSAENLLMDPAPLLRMVVQQRLSGAPVAEISGAFHNGFVRMLAQAAVAASERTGLKTVALSGGTFANRLVVEGLASSLRDAGLEVLLHRDLPPGDGCLSLGQAVIAHHRLT